ncbi:Trp biosynthesis-associated membrane protein [Arthrobacter sp. NPDC090010]|uniref:Trp biosynthesis-associated membrane protein n=1 Tax=Arthrobacter sp. NPDC090010 TaxID=3363942 RepID=UPI00382E83DE
MSSRPAPRWSRKALVVLITVLIAVAAFGTTTQSWINVIPASDGVRMPEIHVPGSKAATAVTALAVVGVAGAIASSIAGRIARWVIAAAIALAGAGIVAAGSTVLSDPKAAAQGEIARQTGVSNGPAQLALTAFPSLAVVAGGLLVLCALWLILASRHWVTRSKYDAGTRRSAAVAPVDEADDGEPLDAIDSWDRLSRGEDPS